MNLATDRLFDHRQLARRWTGRAPPSGGGPEAPSGGGPSSSGGGPTGLLRGIGRGAVFIGTGSSGGAAGPLELVTNLGGLIRYVRCAAIQDDVGTALAEIQVLSTHGSTVSSGLERRFHPCLQVKT